MMGAWVRALVGPIPGPMGRGRAARGMGAHPTGAEGPRPAFVRCFTAWRHPWI